jgi:hypothetical protein
MTKDSERHPQPQMAMVASHPTQNPLAVENETAPPLTMCFGCCIIKMPDELQGPPKTCCGKLWSTPSGLLLVLVGCYILLVIGGFFGYMFSAVLTVIIVTIPIAIPVFFGTTAFIVTLTTCIGALHVRRHRLVRISNQRRKMNQSPKSPTTSEGLHQGHLIDGEPSNIRPNTTIDRVPEQIVWAILIFMVVHNPSYCKIILEDWSHSVDKNDQHQSNYSFNSRSIHCLGCDVDGLQYVFKCTHGSMLVLADFIWL